MAAALLRKRSHMHGLPRSATLPSGRPADVAAGLSTPRSPEGGTPMGSPPTAVSLPPINTRGLSRAFLSAPQRGRAMDVPGGRDAGAGSPRAEASVGPTAMLLARTFSVGASMHQLARRKIDSLGDLLAAEDAAPEEEEAGRGVVRSASATTLQEGSSVREQEEDDVYREE